MPGAPISLNWIELGWESRGWGLSRSGGPTQEIHLVVEADGFLDEAATQTIPGTSTILYQDDEEMQAQVVPYFVNSFGTLVKKFYLDIDKYVLLYVENIQAEQITWSKWKLVITFGIPEDNGQSQGGGGGETGPSDNENNSQEFTQLSFNCTIGYARRQTATLIESQVTTVRGAASLTPTDTVGPNRFIGVTENGVEGAEVAVRGFSFQIVQYMPPTKLTYAYMRRLSRLTSCINASTFFGFARGSVMCTGAQAGGHLYQNVPVTLEFEVKTNVYYSATGPARLAPLDDYYILSTDGKKVVNTLSQFDTHYDSEFPGTIIDSGLGIGIHSGWSIIEYIYAAQVQTSSKTLPRLPTERRIFLPEEVLYVEFNNFLL